MNEQHKEYYLFLEQLRQSGVTNMFGASPYLQEAFDLSKNEANSILLEWMNNYDEISKKYYN